MTDITIQDLISTSFEQKPLEFQDAFNSLIGARIADAIDNKKVEVAQTMFGGEQPETEIESDTEEQDVVTEPEEDLEEPQDGEAA